MKYYFALQYKLFSRNIKENGISPVFAIIFLIGAFIGISMYWFTRSEWAVYAYSLIPFSFLSTLGGQKRNEFLQINYTRKNWRNLRIIENALATFPFVAFLIFKQYFILSVLLLAGTTFFSLLTFRTRPVITLPTPFHRFPFEFTTGFRKSYLGIIVSYILLIIGITINNFNLAIFGFAFNYLICVSYYNVPEKEFYVWIFSKPSKEFLLGKIKIALFYTLGLSLPALIALLVVYPSEIWILLGVFVSGILLVITALLGKYALYPSEVNLTQIFCIIFSVLFPPLMLLVIPAFYISSLRRLNPLLA